MDSRTVTSDRSSISPTNGRLSPEVVYIYFTMFQDGLKNITEKLSRLSVTMETLLETEKEQKNNYAAINAQLHIIQERLRAVEENNTLPFHSSRVSSAHTRFSDLSIKGDRSSNAGADELSGTETIHRECLTEHLEIMVKNFDLSNTGLLDDLLGEECLTQDEASGIREGPDRKDQIRKLVIHIAKRSKGKFVKFLATIEKREYYPYIAKCLKESYEKRTSEELNKECLLCAIKQDVDVKDVVDKLCKHKLVGFDFLDLVIKSGSFKDQSHLWEVIFSHVDNAPNRLNAIKILQEALTIKHENLSAKLGQCKVRQFSNHQCLSLTMQQVFSSMSLDRSWRSSSSIGDLSTTSDRSARPSAVVSTEKDSIDEYPVQSTEISSTSGLSSNLPLTVDWVMKHNQMLANNLNVNQVAADSTTQEQRQGIEGPPHYEKEIQSANSASESLKSTYAGASSSTETRDIQTMTGNPIIAEQIAEHFQNTLGLQGSASAKTKEKRRSFRKRKQKHIKVDVEKASEKAALAVESKETQTPETCFASGGFSFPYKENEGDIQKGGTETPDRYREDESNEGDMSNSTDTYDSCGEDGMDEVN